MEADRLAQVDAYVAGFGAAARPARDIVIALTEGTWTLDALVATSTLPRRAVEGLLDALGGDLERTHRGVLIRPDRVHAYRERFRAPGPTQAPLPDPLAQRAAALPAMVAEVETLIAAAPEPVRSLDHVTATPETVVRRALWLDANFDLRGARLLCVGDHDLSSLAACAVNPQLSVTAVDVDERLLAYLDQQARRRGWDIRCLFADLRHHLPPAAAGWADMVLTDPPYTPDGVALFAGRGLQGLRDREHGRVLVAYGFGEDHPGLGLKVQRALQRLDVVFEAVLPAFNRYYGAQAIGSASDLYVARPTARTWQRLDRRVATAADNVYTRGPHALEATRAPDGEVARQVCAYATGPDQLPLSLLAGDSWPDDAGTRRVSLARLLTRSETTRGIVGPAAVAADLADDPGPWLLRALLATNARRVALLLPNNHPDVISEAGQRALADLLRPKYDLRTHRSSPTSRYAVVVASRADREWLGSGERLVRWVLERAHGTVGSVWREGLIELSRGLSGGPNRASGEAGGSGSPSDADHQVDSNLGDRSAGSPGDRGTGTRDAVSSGPRPLTKNEARKAIERASGYPPARSARLIDLPKHQILELLDDVADSAAALRAS